MIYWSSCSRSGWMHVLYAGTRNQNQLQSPFYGEGFLFYAKATFAKATAAKNAKAAFAKAIAANKSKGAKNSLRLCFLCAFA